MIQYAAVGILFKAASWSVGFLFLAKGDSKLFFFSELFASSYILFLNIIGYKYFSLTGLGYSYFIGYIILLIQVYLIANDKYAFKFTSEFIMIFIIQLILTLIGLISMRVLEPPYSFLVGAILIISSVFYSFFHLDKRLNFLSYIYYLLKK